jgi:hypothetical protein
MVYSVDGIRWFSRKMDIRHFEARRAKLAKTLTLTLRDGVTLERFK